MELDGAPGAVIAGTGGLTALIDLGDPAIMPGQDRRSLPSPITLLPAPAPNTPQFRVQLVLAAVPAGGPGSVAAAYRHGEQLSLKFFSHVGESSSQTFAT